jgi:hypothetical protein
LFSLLLCQKKINFEVETRADVKRSAHNKTESS